MKLNCDRFHGLLGALAITALAAALAVGCSGSGESPAPASAAADNAFDENLAYADVERMVALGPRPSGSQANAEQARMLAEELRGAGVEEVRIGKPPLRNVTGTIPGRGTGYVVVGAHHDTKDIEGFLGANDGASGVAVVLQLARSLPKPLPGPSLAIALFDGEEARAERDFDVDGMRGSRRYVEQAAGRSRPAGGVPPLRQVRAMVLFDMVGDCDLQIPREFSSDEELYDRFAGAAGGAPFEGVVGSINDDHVPFLEAGIPAVDLIDLTYGGEDSPGEYWHTTADTTDKVCRESLDAVGEAALKAIPALG